MFKNIEVLQKLNHIRFVYVILTVSFIKKMFKTLAKTAIKI